MTFKGKEGKSETRDWRSQVEERVSKSILRLVSESPSVKSHLCKGKGDQLTLGDLLNSTDARYELTQRRFPRVHQ